MVVMEPSPGPVFSVSYCRSLGTGLLVMPTQWGRQALDLQTHWTVSGAADLMFSCVTFVWPSGSGLNVKVAESGDVENVSGWWVWLEAVTDFCFFCGVGTSAPTHGVKSRVAQAQG